MKVYKTMTKKNAACIWSITGIALALLMIFPRECRVGAENGVFLCIQVLIPSLFPFMILSDFIVKTGVTSTIPKCMEKPTQFIFGLPKDSCAVILLSLTGGYPVGAKTISCMYKDKIITLAQAKKMSLFCVASGPGFLITFVGCSMLSDKTLGYILLMSQIISFIISGVIAKWIIKEDTKIQCLETKPENLSIGEALVKSVLSSIKSCAYMCALVILFGAICEIYIKITTGFPNLIWVTSLIEITNGVKFLSQGYSPVIISAMCGFSGLCVHFQIFSLLQEISIPKVTFYLFRILQGILNGTFTYILLLIFPRKEAVFSTVSKVTPDLNKGITGCAFLIICCVIFLISINDKRQHIRKLQ